MLCQESLTLSGLPRLVADGQSQTPWSAEEVASA